MVGSASRFVLACAVFHADLHSACGAKRNRAQPPDLVVQPAVPFTQHLAKDTRYGGGQVGLVGILHTWGRNLALSPAYPLPGCSRRPGSRYPNLAACPAGVLAANQGALENLPRQVQAGIAQDSSLHVDSRQGLAAGLGGGR